MATLTLDSTAFFAAGTSTSYELHPLCTWFPGENAHHEDCNCTLAIRAITTTASGEVRTTWILEPTYTTLDYWSVSMALLVGERGDLVTDPIAWQRALGQC